MGDWATNPRKKCFSQGGIEPPAHETSSLPRGCRHDGASRCPAPFTSRGSVILFADLSHNEHVDATCLHPSKWWQRFPFHCLFVTGRLTPKGEIQSSLCDSPWQRKGAAPIEGAAGVAAARGGEGKLRAAMGRLG